jgi:hypothetical protein
MVANRSKLLLDGQWDKNLNGQIAIVLQGVKLVLVYDRIHPLKCLHCMHVVSITTAFSCVYPPKVLFFTYQML